MLNNSLPVTFRGQTIGQFYADLVVEDCIIIDLKVVARILPEHQAQLIHYLKSSELPVGLLVNFGTPRVQIKRVYWEKELKELLQDQDDYLNRRHLNENLRSK